MPHHDFQYAIDRYLQLVSERPELFIPSDELNICLDSTKLLSFSTAHNKMVGVVYESPWHIMIVDLVTTPDGKEFTYERIIESSSGTAVVTVAVLGGKILLAKHYRHAIRAEQYGFVRGFAEDGLSAVENAIKELEEEANAPVTKSVEVGEISADSGLTSTIARVVFCEITYYENTRTEGMTDVELISVPDFEAMIANGEINDGFTLGAYALCKARQLI